MVHYGYTDPTQATACFVIVLAKKKQDAEERFSGQQFCQMERDELMNWLDQLKWTTFKDGLEYFRSDWTGKSIPFDFYLKFTDLWAG